MKLYHILVMSITYGRFNMNSLKNLKMKKVKGFFSTDATVKKARVSLEEKTEKDFRDFTRAKQNVKELVSNKHLD